MTYSNACWINLFICLFFHILTYLFIFPYTFVIYFYLKFSLRFCIHKVSKLLKLLSVFGFFALKSVLTLAHKTCKLVLTLEIGIEVIIIIIILF